MLGNPDGLQIKEVPTGIADVLCRICQPGILTELVGCIVMADDDGVRAKSVYRIALELPKSKVGNPEKSVELGDGTRSKELDISILAGIE